jgi:HK97 family phage prohead protease
MINGDLLAGLVLHRAAETLDVSYPERMIDLIVIPYDDEIEVEILGQQVRESVAPGAFDGVETRPNRIKLNREHQRELTMGHAKAFYPSRPEGLVAKVYVSRTPLGDEALELAADGSLEVSAGFKPTKYAWLDRARSRIRYSKCWLDHIALTSRAAYENAQVLAVRTEEPATVAVAPSTPNLDAVLAWRLEQQYSAVLTR